MIVGHVNHPCVLGLVALLSARYISGPLMVDDKAIKLRLGL